MKQTLRPGSRKEREQGLAQSCMDRSLPIASQLISDKGWRLGCARRFSARFDMQEV